MDSILFHVKHIIEIDYNESNKKWDGRVIRALFKMCASRRPNMYAKFQFVYTYSVYIQDSLMLFESVYEKFEKIRDHFLHTHTQIYENVYISHYIYTFLYTTVHHLRTIVPI